MVTNDVDSIVLLTLFLPEINMSLYVNTVRIHRKPSFLCASKMRKAPISSHSLGIFRKARDI